MKKCLLFCTTLALLSTVSCRSIPTKWDESQRAEFAEMMDDYRQMVYLNELTEPEFIVFTSRVSNDLEVDFPYYIEFIAMPELTDTIDLRVVTTIVEDLDADAANLRYLYPYHTLVAQGVLPSEMNHTERNSFYSCLAQKVDDHFSSLESFFAAVISNSLDSNIITTMQQECAAPFLLP